MDERELIGFLEGLKRQLPSFSDGRIDYTNSSVAVVVTVFVKYGDEMLLLKRGGLVGTYNGRWNTVAGYLDEPVPVKTKVLEELREEVGITEEVIEDIHVGESLGFSDDQIKRKWIVFPVMVTLSEKPEIKLDWEHTEFRWVKRDDLSGYNTVFTLGESLENSLK